MIDFSTLSRRDAEAYCERYVAAVPEQVAWLHEEVVRTAGPVEALDAGPDGLEPLYLRLVERIQDHGGHTAP